MSKTITIRLPDAKYDLFKALATMENRPISNFMETATLRYCEVLEYVDEFEMTEIRSNEALGKSISRAHREAKDGKGRFI